METIDSRTPPQSKEAERACLGSMMLDEQTHCISALMAIVKADDFYVPDHRIIFSALAAVQGRVGSVDMVLLRDELKRMGQFDEIGGVDYLTTLADSVPSAVNGIHYARIVRDKARLRGLIRLCGELTNAAYAEPQDVGEFYAEGQGRLLDAFRGQDDHHVPDMAELVAQVAENLISGEHRRGVETGFVELDELTGGFHPGEIIVVAGRPSMGKTALALNIAEHVAGNGQAAGLFSLEMGREALTQRLLMKASGLDSVQLRSNYLTDDDRQKLTDAGTGIGGLNLLIDDRAGLSITQIRARAQHWQQQYPLALVIIDYLQLIQADRTLRNKYEKISALSNAVKTMARTLNLPVVLLAQLNRNTEGRDEHRPRLSDLRDSGEIEQDADVVMLLHRPDYYNADRQGSVRDGRAELIIAKHRNGPTDTIKLLWKPGIMSFENEKVGVL